MKARVVGYWVCTALITFAFLPGGIFYLMRQPQAVTGVEQLGFPLYFVIFLGVWKVLGPIAGSAVSCAEGVGVCGDVF